MDTNEVLRSSKQAIENARQLRDASAARQELSDQLVHRADQAIMKMVTRTESSHAARVQSDIARESSDNHSKDLRQMKRVAKSAADDLTDSRNNHCQRQERTRLRKSKPSK